MSSPDDKAASEQRTKFVHASLMTGLKFAISTNPNIGTLECLAALERMRHSLTEAYLAEKEKRHQLPPFPWKG